MTKQLIALLLLFLCVPLVNAEEENILAQVEGTARAWFELIDSGKYKESWETSSSLFKAKIPESEWIKSITGMRSSRGTVNARYLATAGSTKTLPGFPEGDYVVLQFYTTFMAKGLALETSMESHATRVLSASIAASNKLNPPPSKLAEIIQVSVDIKLIEKERRDYTLL